eukprot:TRINITY_DN2086_c7_g1_i1.p1 TRINITY_DN2086_c7_g1~~TRINITY_DN2086_c7_g1_i1.p1  ORF type:complete len:633 (+),score=176.44 TRINITY_DN2086_c7_g1_i1:87-1901(+)
MTDTESAVVDIPHREPDTNGCSASPRTPIDEDSAAVCPKHHLPAELVCKHPWCKGALICTQCTMSQGHKGHNYETIANAADKTRKTLQHRLPTMQADVEHAQARQQRLWDDVGLADVAFERAREEIQTHFELARIERAELRQRDVVAGEESCWRAVLQVHEAAEREAHTSLVVHLRLDQRLGRKEILAEEAHYRQWAVQLFHGDMQRTLLQSYISRRSALVSQTEAVLAEPQGTANNRVAALVPLCTSEAVPAGLLPDAAKADAWKLHGVFEQPNPSLREQTPSSTPTPRSAAEPSPALQSTRQVVQEPAAADVEKAASYPLGADVLSLAVSPCGMLCCAGAVGGGLHVFDISNGTRLMEDKQEGNPYCVAFSRCGVWLAVTSDRGFASLYRTAGWEFVHRLVGHTTIVRGAGWLHSGHLVTGAKDGLRMWEPETGVLRTSVASGISDQVFRIPASPTSAFATSDDDMSISEFDVGTLNKTRTLVGHTSNVFDLALTSDNLKLLSCSYDQSLKVWCTVSRNCLQTLCSASQPLLHLSVVQEANLVAVIDSSSASVLDLTTGACIKSFPVSSYWGVCLSPCGRWIFTPGDQCVQVRVVSGNAMQP